MDYFQQYLNYVGLSESPIPYHRWTSLSIISALLGRRFYLPFGHSSIFPNMYIQLIGSPGVRKSTAISIGKKLLSKTGYHKYAPDRLSKERFLIEMSATGMEFDEEDSDLEELVMDIPHEMYVVADEFSDFVGSNNMEFITMLTKLWDCPDEYTHPKIHGKSVVVHKPTVNIISGNTPTGLINAIPAESVGNGFLSRMLFIYAEDTKIKITFPLPPATNLVDPIVQHLMDIKENVTGECTISAKARKLFDRMYREFHNIDDPRFLPYCTRRFTHLLKLSMVIAAASVRTEITEEDALRANTLLHNAELKMPKALGEFGKSRYADVANKILDALGRAVKPMTHNEIWKLVSKDLMKTQELGDIIKGLMAAEKIQVITLAGKQGYMPLFTEIKEWCPSLLLEDFLTPNEF